MKLYFETPEWASIEIISNLVARLGKRIVDGDEYSPAVTPWNPTTATVGFHDPAFNAEEIRAVAASIGWREISQQEAEDREQVRLALWGQKTLNMSPFGVTSHQRR